MSEGDLEAADQLRRARLRLGLVDHSNLHLWAKRYVADQSYVSVVGAMLAIRQLMCPLLESEGPAAVSARSDVDARLAAWLRGPHIGDRVHLNRAPELDAFSDPEWSGAPGQAILDPAGVELLFVMSVVSARAELAWRWIEAADLDMSSRPNGAWLWDPLFDRPAVEAIRRVVVAGPFARPHDCRRTETTCPWCGCGLLARALRRHLRRRCAARDSLPHLEARGQAPWI